MALSSKNKSAIFIDIGHSKCRLIILSAQLTDLKVYEAATEGFAKGKVTDRSALTATIQRLVEAAQINDHPYVAVLNIPASHTRPILKSINYRLGGIYRPSDYEALIELAQDSCLGGLEEVIDVMPLQLKIDEKISDALSFGMSGEELTARLMLATHPRILLSDLLACINAAGIEIAEFRSNAFGAARALQYLRPGAENSVLLDIGHSTVTGALQVGGVINQVFCIPAGSGHISRDLSVGLGASLTEAESLKIRHGISDKPTVEAPSKKIRHFVLPRVSELMNLSFRNFAIYSRSLDGGLLLTGCGAQLIGLPEYIASRFESKPPFVAHLTNAGAKTFVGMLKDSQDQSVTDQLSSAKIDSGWISILAQVRCHVLHQRAIIDDRNQRPLSRLRPLWTWLSELSR